MSAASSNSLPLHETRKLSVELIALSQESRTADLTLRELMERLEGRVYTLFLVLLSVPFCQPIALPGLSTPFGAVIALLGLRLALRQQPWLPQRLLRTSIPENILSKLFLAGAKLLSGLEKLLHPRLSVVFDFHVTHFAVGAVICLCGILLALPLPIPFTNLLPALTVIFVAISVTERDSVTLGIGAVLFAVTLAFFGVIFWGGVEVIHWLQETLNHFFYPQDDGASSWWWM